jgi:hypothetical protein
MLKSTAIRFEIELDEFVIMPNHIHGIVIITEYKNCLVGATHWVDPSHWIAPTDISPNRTGMSLVGRR